jgi:hypothetical protein
MLENIDSPDLEANRIKLLVRSKVVQHALVLRPDAELFLVLNFSQMIFRAYAGAIPADGASSPTILPRYREFSPNETNRRIGQAIDIILASLNQGVDPDGISAHEVLRKIDLNWQQLGELFAWG